MLPTAALAATLAATLIPAPAAADDRSCGALLEAAFFDEPDEVRQILAAGTDVNCRDQDRQTALMIAAEGGSLDASRVLLAHGARVDVRDVFGHTAMDRAQSKLPFYHRPGGQKLRLVYEGVIRLLKNARSSSL
ncbi:MAG: ankyrin repeat domain-containing protein [Hyphomicrobiales bacterium]|nr:ankyrin repeat domain-containing protein [Hyphomicrobiales bacterium]